MTVVNAMTIKRGAQISDCGRYRYLLYRRWDVSKPRLVWIMLNPSTADGWKDDPTIRRCVGFARRGGFGGIRVLNLFAWRATHPRDLRDADDPVGPENDHYLERNLGSVPFGEVTVAAWGARGAMPGRHRRRDHEVMSIVCNDMGHTLHCLGLTKAGHPKHPLYVPSDTEIRPWVGRDNYFDHVLGPR